MLFIPGFIISLFTFPGVMVHEYAHKMMCERRGLRVTDVCYFRIGSPAGYVKHAKPTQYSDGFAISVAPFLVNTVLAVVLFGLAAVSYHLGRVLIPFALGWLGLSVGMHAFPSPHDGKNIWELSKREWRSSLYAALGFPVVVLIYIGHLASLLWADVIYAGGLAYMVFYASEFVLGAI